MWKKYLVPMISHQYAHGLEKTQMCVESMGSQYERINDKYRK